MYVYWWRFSPIDRYAFLHCVSAFGTTPKVVPNSLSKFARRFTLWLTLQTSALLGMGVAAVGGYVFYTNFIQDSLAGEVGVGHVDYAAVREDIDKVIEEDDNRGPLLVRLAWHSSGTYAKKDRSGGSCGATMRYEPESKWGANAGLNLARDLLEPIKAKHPNLTYSDLWALAGAQAVEAMAGPEVSWRPGRTDAPVPGQAADPKRHEVAKKIVEDGRLPDASQGAQHLRDIFHRMGFNDQEIVALSGAHALGRCHTDRSGYEGPWTRAPTTMSNMYFTELLGQEWVLKNTKDPSWKGPLQYVDKATGELMMLPTDLALLQDATFKKWVDVYAKDEDKFFQDFAKAFSRLLELGVAF
jgi:cytochrome c peroxidase